MNQTNLQESNPYLALLFKVGIIVGFLGFLLGFAFGATLFFYQGATVGKELAENINEEFCSMTVKEVSNQMHHLMDKCLVDPIITPQTRPSLQE